MAGKLDERRRRGLGPYRADRSSKEEGSGAAEKAGKGNDEERSQMPVGYWQKRSLLARAGGGALLDRADPSSGQASKTLVCELLKAFSASSIRPAAPAFVLRARMWVTLSGQHYDWAACALHHAYPHTQVPMAPFKPLQRTEALAHWNITRDALVCGQVLFFWRSI